MVGPPAPTGTPSAIVARVHKVLEEVQNVPELQAQFEKEGVAIKKISPPQFERFIASEMKKWERVVKEAGIKAK